MDQRIGWSLHRKWRFVTMVMGSLIYRFLAARKLTLPKFKPFFSYRIELSGFLVFLKFCEIHKTSLSDTTLKTENVVIFA